MQVGNQCSIRIFRETFQFREVVGDFYCARVHTNEPSTALSGTSETSCKRSPISNPLLFGARRFMANVFELSLSRHALSLLYIFPDVSSSDSLGLLHPGWEVVSELMILAVLKVIQMKVMKVIFIIWIDRYRIEDDFALISTWHNYFKNIL